jgi:hypothetical protein
MLYAKDAFRPLISKFYLSAVIIREVSNDEVLFSPFATI